jgi:hypothetical protein
MRVKKMFTASALAATAAATSALISPAPASANVAKGTIYLCAQSSRAAKVDTPGLGTLQAAANTCNLLNFQRVQPGTYTATAFQQVGSDWINVGHVDFSRAGGLQVYVKTVNGIPTAEFYVG